MTTAYDLIVIGEGITGLTCAQHAKSLGLRTATTEGNLFGGLVINVAELEGYDTPGSGVDIASALMEANANEGIESLGGTVSALRREGDSIRIVADAGEFTARAVVIATGARLRKLGVPGEEEFDHRGVSQCADCDGPMFHGEHVVVVGGGDAAFQEAAALSHYVDEVTVLTRGAAPRARHELVERVQGLPNVSIRPSVQVEAIHGTETVNAITVRANGTSEKIDCAGVFVFVGLTPNSEIAPAEAARDAGGALLTDAAYQTAVPGLFAAGAVRSGYSGKLVDAVREGRAAAENAAKWIAG